MIIISYATLNTPYTEVIKKRLIPSLEQWNLKHDIAYPKDKGSWAANTALKCQIIKDMLLKHKEPVCFIDSDATIEKYPELLFNLPEVYDIAFHYLNWYGHWRNQWENTAKMELLSGTMVWNYNEKVLSLLDDWIKEVNKDIGVWEQQVLNDIVKERDDLVIYVLPAEYCCVVKQDYSIPKYISDPIIVHWQASRQYRKNT